MTSDQLYKILDNAGIKYEVVEIFEGLRTIDVLVDEDDEVAWDVNYAGCGEDGVHQYIIVDAKTFDEYVDPQGDLLSFPTEEEAWEHINTLKETESSQ